VKVITSVLADAARANSSVPSVLADALKEGSEKVEDAVKYTRKDTPIKKLDRIESGKGANSRLTLEDAIVSKIRDVAGRDNVKQTARGPVVTAVRQKSSQARRVARDPRKVSRTEAMGRPPKTKTFGQPTVKQFVRASQKGQVRKTKDGRVITVPQQKAVKNLKASQAVYAAARAKAGSQHFKALKRAGLDNEQAKVLSTVLKVGDRMGATPKEKLAAVMTAIQESGIRNLGYGDADSAGWRQERQMYYPTGAQGPNNVKASARRFFQESISDTGGARGAGQTAGQLAQTIQASAYPDRYDERRGEAVPLLQAFNRAPSRAIPKKVKKDLAASVAVAKRLGVPVGKNIEEAQGLAPGRNKAVKALVDHSWPLGVKGRIIATAADHGSRAFGNWMSDNAVDIEVPVGTPVKAMRDSVVYKVSGSAPNHAANPAGWTVYLRDKDGQEYSYMHLDAYSVKVGDTLKAGQTFGKSGAANGVPHLHLAVLEGKPGAALKGGSVAPRYMNFSKKGPGTSSRPNLVKAADSDTILKFQTPMMQALVKLAKLSGEPVTINEGFRTRARQQYLYDNQGTNGIGVAAAPGTSNHEHGAAADVRLTPKQEALLGQVGLSNQVVAGEPWHVELVGDAASGIVDGLTAGGSMGGGIPVSGGVPSSSGSGSSCGSGARVPVAGAGAYGGGVDSPTLPESYMSLIMGAGAEEPGDADPLAEFITGRAKPRKRR